MALSKIQTIENQVIPDLGHRNLIINGAHNINQRQMTGALDGDNIPITVTTAAAYRTVDRWKSDIDGSHGHDFSLAQSDDAPDGFTRSSKATVVTSGAKPSTSAMHQIYTLLEKRDVEQLKWGTSEAKTAMFSFYVKSSVTGNHGLRFFHYNSDSSTSVYYTYYTINVANTWERKSITITGPTTGGIEPLDYEQAWGVEFLLGAAADTESGSGNAAWSGGSFPSGLVYLPATAGATWFVTGCQFEEGTIATPFEHIQPSTELIRCNRYFYRPSRVTTNTDHATHGYGLIHSSRYSTDASRVHIGYPVQMRIDPNLTYSQAGGVVDADQGGSHRANLQDSDDSGFYVYNFRADAEL